MMAVILTSFFLPQSAAAHPLHQASAEADYNPLAKTLEVSTAFYANDLEAALTQLAGRAVSLENTPPKDLDPQLQSLLKETFVLTNPAGATLPLTWVGKQFEPPPAPPPAPSPASPQPALPPAAAPSAALPIPAAPAVAAHPITPAAGEERRMILFFQIPLPDGLAGHSLKFNTLTNLFPDQKNLIQIHRGPQRASLAFSPSSLAKPIKLSIPPAPADPASAGHSSQNAVPKSPPP
ncbi:MAG: hypothetical protein JWL81_1547 [Verrucomicrobiales bacterium]|nr:hypothetical protein [Verrucomicrobiales bacterium]